MNPSAPKMRAALRRRDGGRWRACTRRAEVSPRAKEIPPETAQTDRAEGQRVNVEERCPQQTEEAQQEKPEGENQNPDRKVEQQSLSKREPQRRQQSKAACPTLRQQVSHNRVAAQNAA